MTNGINTRELILQILLEIEEEGKHSHIAIRNALSKYQFLPRQERAFITRVCEGTLEYRILIDYIIDSYSKVTVDKMKPAIREILRVEESGTAFKRRKSCETFICQILYAGDAGESLA